MAWCSYANTNFDNQFQATTKLHIHAAIKIPYGDWFLVHMPYDMYECQMGSPAPIPNACPFELD